MPTTRLSKGKGHPSSTTPFSGKLQEYLHQLPTEAKGGVGAVAQLIVSV